MDDFWPPKSRPGDEDFRPLLWLGAAVAAVAPLRRRMSCGGASLRLSRGLAVFSYIEGYDEWRTVD
jgi:hypothetical protein